MGFYYVLHFSNIPSEVEDSLSSLLFENGAQGVSEDLDFEQTVAQFEPAVLQGTHKNLRAYFSSEPSEDLLSHFRNAPYALTPHGEGGQNAATWRVSKEQDADWLSEWKKGYIAFPLSEDFWIVPRWEKVPPEAKISFHIEPGMAFGTGTHETTQLVAQMMAHGDLGDSFLDVGTGTGLLAFYALRLGSKKVVAIDNDPVAVEVARENLAYNNASEILVSGKPLKALKETYQVVAANIIQSVLLKLRADLVASVEPGGQLLLSGVLKEHEQEFVAEFFCDDQLSLKDRYEKGGWVALRALRGGEE